jgi:8-oxo-dGTP diphosphatase
MSKSYTYNYPRPMVTVDFVVFGFDGESLRSLFIRRQKDPFAGRWAIPGGYLEIDEPIEAGARRELKEETGLDAPALVRQIGVFGDPGRDPRGRTISVAHVGIVRGLPVVAGGDDAAEAAWLDPAQAVDLAFDHDQILHRARRWLASSLTQDEVASNLLPDPFDGTNVIRLFRSVLGSGSGGKSWMAARIRRGTVARAANGPSPPA